MEQMIKLEMTKEDASLLGMVMDQCLQTVKESLEKMDQAEAERLQLQAETQAMLTQMRTMFNAEKNLS
jgi:hypothetical protein